MSKTLDPRILRAFVAVARDGQVSRAAERLHLSQPAVSLQLRQLAECTGIALFTRHPHGLQLTRQGHALLAQAERCLTALGEFSALAQRLSNAVGGLIRVGTILDPEFIRLGAFLSALVARAPELAPELQHGMSGDVLLGVRRGELDVAYYVGHPEHDFADASLHVEPLTRFAYRVIAPAGWGARVLQQDWRALAALPWILTPPASVHHRLLAATLTALDVQPVRVAMVDQEASMLALVRSGIGLSLCRDSIAIRESQAHGLVIADQVGIDAQLAFVCLRAQRERPNVACALGALRDVWHPA